MAFIGDDFLTWATDPARSGEQRFGIELLAEMLLEMKAEEQ